MREAVVANCEKSWWLQQRRGSPGSLLNN
jgi:hypothetical protein